MCSQSRSCRAGRAPWRRPRTRSCPRRSGRCRAAWAARVATAAATAAMAAAVAALVGTAGWTCRCTACMRSTGQCCRHRRRRGYRRRAGSLAERSSMRTRCGRSRSGRTGQAP
eukprot:scaffold98504_cov55-Phaeocystis_antarctica.AAC.2